MMAQGLLFIILNGTGHSLQTISLSTEIDIVTSVSLGLFAVAGVMKVFYIVQCTLAYIC